MGNVLAFPIRQHFINWTVSFIMLIMMFSDKNEDCETCIMSIVVVISLCAFLEWTPND